LTAPLTMRSVTLRIAEETGVSMEELRGPRRFRHIVQARRSAMEACYAIRWEDGRRRYSSLRIGAYFGRHASSVLGLIGRLEKTKRLWAPGAPTGPIEHCEAFR
jgi:chromosomal replication initiation ATPase DnaA